MCGGSGAQPKSWRFSYAQIGLILASCVLLIYLFSDGLIQMVSQWESSEEYGYGYMIPFIVAFFIWQKKDDLQQIEFSGSYSGLVLLFVGGILLLLGELATLFIVVQYAFIITIFGLLLALMGWRAFREILPALCLLFFMIPLPNFLYQELSAKLQLISSQLGVAVIRLFDISVYLEGNVIDLGAYKLQVVEACSGLRYLFPLAALSYMAAYIYKGAWWKKAVVFLSSMPITVIMNSFRIGMIGVLVEYFGIEQAEGFLHDFEGWIVFMACMLLLVAEMWVLSRVGKDKVPFSDAFAIELPDTGSQPDSHVRVLPLSYRMAIPFVLVISLAPVFIHERVEVPPERQAFSDFPLVLDEWDGRKQFLDRVYIDTLKFSDYVLADYAAGDGGIVNFYSAYYASQRKGASAHSPRSCIPGGGWQITSLKEYVLDGVNVYGAPLRVNRLVIQKGDVKQLVYYWFQQRGRVITNEYLVKWYLFLDAMMKNRTDGALLRLTTMLEPQQDIGIADQRLRSFAEKLVPLLPEYIPD